MERGCSILANSWRVTQVLNGKLGIWKEKQHNDPNFDLLSCFYHLLASNLCEVELSWISTPLLLLQGLISLKNMTSINRKKCLDCHLLHLEALPVLGASSKLWFPWKSTICSTWGRQHWHWIFNDLFKDILLFHHATSTPSCRTTDFHYCPSLPSILHSPHWSPLHDRDFQNGSWHLTNRAHNRHPYGYTIA